MGTLNKEQLQGFKTSDVVTVPVTELGGDFKFKAVSGQEFETFLDKIRGVDGKVSEKGLIVRTIIACACDDNGAFLFGDSDADYKIVNDLPRKVLTRIFKIAQKQCGMDDEEKKDLTGKSEASPG